MMNELQAAGIADPEIAASFRECKKLNARFGKSYFLATRFLPKEKRPYVHALYGFARYADEIVDNYELESSVANRDQKFKAWRKSVETSFKSGETDELVLKALLYTIKKFDLKLSYFQAFLNSMEMDLTVSTYRNFEDLMGYVYGSASVIGLEMVPILGTSNLDEANICAEKLGTAFQLANFIRDVGEDVDRGRIYLPLEELESFGVKIESVWEKKITPNLIEAIKFQIARVRQLKFEADQGIGILSAESRPCIEAASELYCGIVDEVEKIDYQIFSKRAKTSIGRRLSVAVPAYLKAIQSRR